MSIRRLRLAGALLAVAALVTTGGSAVGASGPSDAVVAGPETAVETLDSMVGPVMVELEGAPAAVAYADSEAQGASKADAARAGREQKGRNDADQRSVRSAIAASGIDAPELYSVQSAYNGIAVQVDTPGEAARLAELPGVKAVHAIPLVEADNASSVDLIGAHAVWEAFGETGDGMTIGVIDTGVDYVHTNFGGSGSSADYVVATSAGANVETADAHSPFSIPGIYPNARVVGGHDLVGDAYNAGAAAGSPALTPHPDRNPMDCNGHGSHVAGTAAGSGVNADGSTYTGDYDESVPAETMRIGPGVAPEADIYAIRVFGCGGSTAVTTQAIDWALDPNGDGDPSDHLDVINMSLGSPLGTADDSSAAASDNAVRNGVIVVASAGNNTDVYYITGSPASASRAISVASSTDAVDITDAFRVNSPASIAGLHGGSRSVNFNWTSPPASAPLPMTADLYYPATNQYGCAAWTGADLAAIAGKVVLVDWKKPTDATFPCGSLARANNATAAGAKGILMADSVPYLDTAIAGNASIPGLYTTSTVGDALKGALAGGPVSVTLSAEWNSQFRLITPGREDMLSGFSSRGPRGRGAALKPDIAAPGQGIFSTGARTGNQGASNQGTSMAAPHMAGTMALLKATHPDWSVEQLKALVMNTAGHDVYTGLGQSGDRYGVARIGAGRVDIPAAMGNDVVAYVDDRSGAVSVSFGAVQVEDRLKEDQRVRVVNNGSETARFALSYDARTDIPGVEFSLESGRGDDDRGRRGRGDRRGDDGEATIEIRPGRSETFRVVLTADADEMLNTREATVAAVQAGNPRHWLSEEGGYATLTPVGGGTALRVPVYVTARPASDMKATSREVSFRGRNAGTREIRLHGDAVSTGTEPLGWSSKVSAFELQAESPKATLAEGVSELARNADLKQVGAAMNEAKTALYFGISTWGDWAAPATDVQFSVQIDRDRNGTVDATMFNTRFTDSDVFVTALGGSALAFTNVFSSNVTTAPFDNSVVVLPMPVGALGLPAGVTRFNYRVQGLSRFWSGPPIDQTDWLTYDVATPGLAFAGGLGGSTMYLDDRSTRIPVTLNKDAFVANASRGILLLHHLNEAKDRAEVLAVKH